MSGAILAMLSGGLGTGLGLAIVRQIIKLSGGRLVCLYAFPRSVPHRHLGCYFAARGGVNVLDRAFVSCAAERSLTETNPFLISAIP
jgi:hypothetical protein